MKKILLTLALFCSMGVLAYAQSNEQTETQPLTPSYLPDNPVFSAGEHLISGGMGLYFERGYRNIFPPVSFSYEYGLFSFGSASTIGVGAYTGFHAKKHKDYDYKVKEYILTGRIVYHYNLRDNWEVFGGVNLGYDFSWTLNMPSEHQYDHRNFKGIPVAGTRYMLYPGFGVFAECSLYSFIDVFSPSVTAGISIRL